MSKNIINTNIRFNLDNEDDRKAYEYLQGMDRKQYKSYTKAVVIAVNEYFERQQRLEADSYLETREKEDMFLKKVLDTIEQGLKTAGNIGGLSPPSKNGHRKATKNGMNRSHSFIFLKTAAFIPRFT